MKGQKQIFICIILIGLMFTAGCWNYRDISQLSIVAVVGVDRNEESGKYLLTFQILKPGKMKSGGNAGGDGNQNPEQRATLEVESEGETIFEGIRNAVLKTSRKLYFSHNQLVIIGHEVAKEGVRSVLDFFLRDAEPRTTAWIMVAEGKAGEVIRSRGQLETASGLEINKLIHAQFAASRVGKVDLQQFTGRLTSKSTEPIAPLITLADQFPKMQGMAIFKGDRMVGTFDLTETRGLLWVIGEVQSGIIVGEIPDGKGKASLEIIRASSEIKARSKDMKIEVEITINLHSNLGEQRSSIFLAKPEGLRYLEKEQGKIIKSEINKALKKARVLQADVFGFGAALYRTDPKLWKKLETKWEEAFETVDVLIKVNSNIRQTGLLIKPPISLEE